MVRYYNNGGSGGGSALTVQDIDGVPTVLNVNTIQFSNGSVTDNGGGNVTVTTGSGGGGDVSSNTATSVDSELVLFSGTGGKTIKRATGTGVVYATSGVMSISKVVLTQPATSSTLTVADGKTLTVSNTLTFTGTDSSSVAFGTGGTVAYTANTLAVFASTTSAQLAGVISDETGTGKLVFGTAPTFASTISVGTISGTTGLIALNGTVGGTVNITTAANAGSWTLTLPTTAGTNTYVLATDGSGGTSWVIPSAATIAIGTTVTSGTTGSILFVGAGPVIAQNNAQFFWDDTNVQLRLGSGGSVDGFNNVPLSIVGSTNQYFATNIQNKSSGTSASATYVAANDIDDGTTVTGHYIDMSVNSSTYTDSTYTLGDANDGTVEIVGGNLLIGTWTTGKVIKFFTLSPIAANERVRITDTGMGINTLGTPGAFLEIRGTTKQFIASYDGSNSMDITVSSAGLTTFNATGGSAGFTFSDTVTGTLFDATNRTQGHPINAQTGTSYTFVLADAGKLVTSSNASAQTYTVPPNSSVAYPVGTQIDVEQKGAGKLTLAQGSGVTINSFGGLKSAAGQYIGLTLIKEATDTWTLFGNLVA